MDLETSQSYVGWMEGIKGIEGIVIRNILTWNCVFWIYSKLEMRGIEIELNLENWSGKGIALMEFTASWIGIDLVRLTPTLVSILYWLVLLTFNQWSLVLIHVYPFGFPNLSG